MPLLSTLCNPGLRSRHWKAMSDRVGYDIAPDSSTTLRKMLKNNLSPYMNEFEGISGGASKVSSFRFSSSMWLPHLAEYIHLPGIEPGNLTSQFIGYNTAQLQHLDILLIKLFCIRLTFSDENRSHKVY